jgi:acetylornithine deacetylase/succinyl-diaminopimelate desuccinylase-like protein
MLVDLLSREGTAPAADMQALSESLFRLEWDRVEEVFGGLPRLRRGFDALADMLEHGAGTEHRSALRYTLAMLHLGRILGRDRARMEAIRDRLGHAAVKQAHFSSRFDEIARVFQYHGAEHKTIYAYEAGLPLTVANVKAQSTLPPRCGTTFLIVVVILSIIVGSVVTPFVLPNAVGAVGQVKVFPNSRNVIPGKVIFTVDIRSPEQAKLDLMRGEVERAAHAVAAELGLGIAIEAVGHFDPVTFDPALVRTVRGAAERLGYSHMDIVSGAGHDACWINRVAPTVMIMCPCVDGLSHNEAEEISQDWAAAGSDVLFHAVLETAGVVS